MEKTVKSERRTDIVSGFTETNQFINATSSEEREYVSVVDDSVLSICPQCNFSTVSILSLDAHMEQEHGDNLTTGKDPLEIVVKEEKGSDEAGDRRSELFVSAAVDSQTRSESSSVNSSSVVAGKQVSDSRRRYRCNICPVTFPWHGDLAAHLSEVHGFQKASRDGGKTRAGSYKCSFCMYVAKYQSELKRHRRLHMGVKPFGCVFCKYRSAWKGDLKRHIESHHRGHFTSEEELAAIMAQYKNNAGTDIKGVVDTEGSQEVPVTEASIKQESMPGFLELNEPNKQTSTATLSSNSEEQKTPVQKCPAPFEMGLNLTVSSHNSIEFPMNFNPIRAFPQTVIGSFPQMGESLLKMPSVSSISDISCPQPLPAYMHGFNGDLLSVMVSQNSMSFNDIVGQLMFNSINGMLPPPILQNPILNNSLIISTTNSDNLFPKSTPILSKASKPSPTNFSLINPQHPSFQANAKDLSKPNTGFDFSFTKSSNIFESEKGFKPINGLISCPRSIASDQKSKDNPSGLLITQQEHWKRFKCSACGHRSNWKWDINKHIKVAHPERDGIATIELSYEEAKTTLQSYLNSTKANKARSHNSFESEEGYYRPYKCSACGHRSNWKWDVNKHIKQVHQRQAEVITLTMEEAKSTICQYKRRRRAPGLANFSEHLSHTVASTPTGSIIADKSNISSPMENHSSIDNCSDKEKSDINCLEISPATTNSQQQNPRIDTLRLKRLKCDCCGYRSNYRSDISRHIRRKHDNMASVVFLADVISNESITGSTFTNKLDPEGQDNESLVKQMILTENNDQISNAHRKLWQCNLCQFRHKEKIQVSHHITRNHDPERPFNCKLCHYGTDYRNSLLRHVKAKHKISSIHEVMNQNLSKVKYNPSLGKGLSTKVDDNEDDILKLDSTTCSKCQEVFSTYQDLFQHTVINHSSSDEEMYLIFKPRSIVENEYTTCDFSCSQCPFYSYNSDAAQIHQFQHSEICHYLFRCPHCNYKASHNKFLLNHIGLHMRSSSFYPSDQPEDLSCRKSQANVSRTNDFILPVVKEQSSKRRSSQKIHCNKCQYRTSNICHLRVHLQQKHYKKYSIRKIKDSKSVVSISSFPQIDQNALSNKNDSSTDVKFWCDECGFLTNDKEELRKHLVKHLNETEGNEHKCTLCTYNPDSSIDLKNHQLLHVVYEVSNFKERLGEVHGGHKCDICNFSTNIIDKLDFHKHFHYMSPDGRRFSCPKCSFKHFQLYGLIKHLKYHH